ADAPGRHKPYPGAGRRGPKRAREAKGPPPRSAKWIATPPPPPYRRSMSRPEAAPGERIVVGDRVEARPQSADASAPTRSNENLDRSIRQIAARLKRDFAAEIARDAAAFKRRAVHRLKLHLPPGSGRPCLASVTRAGH